MLAHHQAFLHNFCLFEGADAVFYLTFFQGIFIYGKKAQAPSCFILWI